MIPDTARLTETCLSAGNAPMKGEHNLMLRPFTIGSVLAVAIVGFVLSLSMNFSELSAQDAKPEVNIELPPEPVKEGGTTFGVSIVVDKATNLASFQFSLSYDSSIIRYEGVERRILEHLRREAQCTNPRVSEGSTSTVSFGCVTLGPPVSLGGIAGPYGLASLPMKFSPVGSGTTPLELVEGRLLQAEINEEGRPVELDTAVSSGYLEVESSGGSVSWALW
jgi:hypothetical protein